MIGRFAFTLTLALAIGQPIASRGQSTSSVTAIRWETDPSGSINGVSVVGLKPEILRIFQDPVWNMDRWPSLFSITIESKTSNPVGRPMMLGSYRIEGNSLRFTPRYPFDRGRMYSATFRPSKITGEPTPDIVSTQFIPKRPRSATLLTQIAPSGERVPENLLKFYLYFSSPMARGEVYDRVKLLKADGKAVDQPFLRLAEELWDPTGTRLTLLIDPGRIKQGLQPRELFGPVLEAGQTYTLVVDHSWPDSEGDPLGKDVRKTFLAEAADERQPNPKTWSIASPSASTRDPLTLTFPESLDRALLESAITLVDSLGEAVLGTLQIEAKETLWRFIPENPWLEGNYRLVIDGDLEDLAGNSITRPFEVDIQRDTPLKPEVNLVRLPISIRPKGP